MNSFEIENPYEAPRENSDVWDIPGDPGDQNKDDLYDSARRRRYAAVVLYGLAALMNLVIGGFSLARAPGEDGVGDNRESGAVTQSSDDGDVDSSFGVGYVLALITGNIEIAAFIFLTVWSYRAYANLIPLSGDTPRFSAGWVVANWYIPFVSLVRPVQAMNDIWQLSDVSHKDIDFTRWSTPVFLVAWWLIWLSSGGIDLVVGFSGAASPFTQVFSSVLSAVSNGLTALLVRYLGLLQDEKSRIFHIKSV